MRLPRWLLGAGSLRAMVLVVGGMSVLTFAQTADSLKARFARLLGTGKYAKLVWQDEITTTARKPNFDYGGMWPSNASRIMGMDTKDGIVRQLAGPKTGTHFSSPTFTWDGNKVVWTDNVKQQYVITDFLDTTTKKVLLNKYEGDGHCYRTPDGKNWVLATEAKDGGILYRINVDDTTEKVAIYTCGSRAGYAGASCWASISTDGKFLAAGFPNWGALNFLNVATKTLTGLDTNGCWPTISRDTLYNILYTNDGNYAHQEIRVVDRNQRSVLRKLLGTSVLASSSGLYESLRWTMDRDYLTIWVYTGYFAGAGIPNPRLVRISDLKWAAVVDNPNCAIGNMDVFFYSGTSSVAQLHPFRAKLLGTEAATGGHFDLRGRGVLGASVPNAGIYITAGKSGARACLGVRQRPAQQ